MTVASTPLLAVRGLVKRFPGVMALQGLDFEVRAGEVRCPLGQNGAGKSTLIKVLSGAHRPDEGEIRWQGEIAEFGNPTAAMRSGVAVMYHELDLVAGLSVADNVFLGHGLSTMAFARRAEARRRTRALLDRLGHLDIPPDRDVGRLSVAHQQVVSMARALSLDGQLLIMDEPSAVLDADEVRVLFGVIRELTAQGVAVVYISHRMRRPARSVTGRALENVFPPRVPEAPEVLVVRGLAEGDRFSGVNLTVRRSEVVGLAGLVGAGRSEILETVHGERKPTDGTVEVDSEQLRRGTLLTRRRPRSTRRSVLAADGPARVG
ncbi:ATP-binding cassette domain-containing protein [Lentzea terrae]|uniref:ATP-binding cassette domain-containing protein n=1 Tax=Lentzea terrae TaxID=2200761 RepID=UPI000DD41F56|nr:ATP-binding cassette domain-containing protein [Lentzea terrae]